VIIGWEDTMRAYPHRLCFLLLGLLAVSLTLPSGAFAQSSDLTPNPAAEQWVSEQIAKGEIADLQTRFPNEEDRVLSADFLMKLLENPDIEITRYGIRIQRAVFDDPLQLAYIEVDHQLWLEDCKFKSDVNLYESHFTGDLFLRGSTFSSAVNLGFSRIEGNLVADDAKFLDKELTANFNSMKVDGLVSLQRAEFAGTADFIGATIGSTFQANGAKFTNPGRWANFSSMKVVGLVSLQKAEFSGSVYFIGTNVGNTFEANEAKFINTELPASFNSMIVGGSVFLPKAEFAGTVDFIGATIGGTFLADETKFTNPERWVSFSSMKVVGLVSLKKAEFSGSVYFIDTNVGGSFEANEAKFTSTEQVASFNSMKVNGPVFLLRADFAGPVDFVRAYVGGNLEANDARFNNKDRGQSVNFESMQVDGDIFLNRVVFAGPVSFNFVEVKSNFLANNAEFQSGDDEPSFNNMIVRRESWFDGTIFKQGADFDNAVFLDLTIRGVNPGTMHISNLRLNQTIVERKLHLESLQVQNLYSRSLVVHGLTNIRNVNFLDSADFENSRFGDLYVEDVNWPSGLRNINLGGMSYQNIQIILESNEDDAWKELITLIDKSKYNAQAYTTLENYFLQQGYTERADAVYIAYKQRERREALKPGSIGWLSNLVLEVFVKYGRNPGLALYWSIFVIGLGWAIFRQPEGMVSLSKREIIGPKVGKRRALSRRIPMRMISSQHEVPYSPFWYSLDLFIPFVDLGFDDKWSPKPTRTLAVVYAKLHMLAGWILIPIGLLAITGVIK
jgi:hypothetical protein